MPRSFSLKLMLTQQTFDTCIFQIPSLLPTEYLVDKRHNQYFNICWSTNTFGQAVFGNDHKTNPRRYYIQWNLVNTNTVNTNKY